MPRNGPGLRQLAAWRLLGAGQDSAERLEKAAVDGVHAGDSAKVRRSLHLRLAMHQKPDGETLNTIQRILALVDEAEQKGISGPVGPAAGAQDQPG